jgi:hypothetical protein
MLHGRPTCYDLGHLGHRESREKHPSQHKAPVSKLSSWSLPLLPHSTAGEGKQTQHALGLPNARLPLNKQANALNSIQPPGALRADGPEISPSPRRLQMKFFTSRMSMAGPPMSAALQGVRTAQRRLLPALHSQ